MQTFIESENFYPDDLKEILEKDRKIKKPIIEESENQTRQRRYEELKKAKSTSDNIMRKCRPLGPKCRISGSLKEQFRSLIQLETGTNLVESVLITSVKSWRQNLVRLVCKTEGEN